MREFNYNFLKEKQWDNEILGYIGLIHEYKGKQQLYLQQKNHLNCQMIFIFSYVNITNFIEFFVCIFRLVLLIFLLLNILGT